MVYIQTTASSIKENKRSSKQNIQKLRLNGFFREKCMGGYTERNSWKKGYPRIATTLESKTPSCIVSINVKGYSEIKFIEAEQ